MTGMHVRGRGTVVVVDDLATVIGWMDHGSLLQSTQFVYWQDVDSPEYDPSRPAYSLRIGVVRGRDILVAEELGERWLREIEAAQAVIA